MQRSSGVTVIAVFAILGSLLCFAMASLTGFVSLVGLKQQAIQPEVAQAAKFGMIFGLIIFAGLAAWGIASAVGLLRLKGWARISTLIFSGLLIFFGILSPLFVLAIPMPPTPNADASVIFAIRATIAGFYLALAAIGAWWMIYLTRPAVKAEFQAGGAPYVPSKRPVSISVIAWVLIIGACCVPFNLLLHLPLMLFGVIIHGWAANLLMILFGAVGLTSAIGLLRLRPYGRLITLGYLLFGMINAVVTWLVPGSFERMTEFMRQMPGYMQTQPQPSFNPVVIAALTVPVMLVPLYFLFKHKAAFEESGMAPPPPPMVSQI